MNKKFQGKVKTIILRAAINLSLLAFCMSVLYPMIFLVINSLKKESEYAKSIFAFPSELFLSNFLQTLSDERFFSALVNSTINSIITTVFVVFAGYVAGFYLARYEFKGKFILYLLFVFALLVPIPALMTPVFLQFKSMGLYNKPYSLLFPYIAFNLSLSVFLFESYISSIPKALDESAFIDGASVNVVVFKIIFPVAMPITATVTILTFLHAWNEFSFALILIRSDEFRTLPVWLSRFRSERTVEYTRMIAAMLLASMPVILIYIVLSKKIMSGFVSGVVKG